jgi:nitrite reductase/ring-hydroxylating ferredoxin subunit/uncharacterized membrane protein
MLVADIAGSVFEKPGLSATAYYLNIGGIGLGLLAAIPGFIDLLKAVPPKSSAKKRAAQHGIINVTMLLIFTIAFFYRRTSTANFYVILAMEFAGVILMSVAGWLGGTLVYRNQIGVDHRYANAGKWNEQRFTEDAGEIVVAITGELKVNSMKLLHFKNKRIVLARTEDSYLAFDDHCPHRGGPLSDGSIACGIVQCPWHGSQFDARTGNVKNGPAKENIKTYEVKQEQEKIFIRI